MPSETHHALSDAIETCYRVFSKYPQPLTWEAPPYREPEQLLAALTAVPLRELPDDALGKYAFWAMTTVGEVEHYKHFLPRILELAITHGQTRPGLTGWLIAGKLEKAHWRDWPQDEIDAIECCYRTGLARFLNDPDQRHEADDWFVGMEKLSIEPGAI